jgi:uncharacterized protein YggE
MDTMISVQGEARVTVPPDRVELGGQLSLVRDSKPTALADVARALTAVTDELAALGGVVLTPDTEGSALTWMATSATTSPEQDHSKQNPSALTGRINANVSLSIRVRDFDRLADVSNVLARHETLRVWNVSWSVDRDNPAWAAVRADAIQAAISKGRDYAAALGGTLVRAEHIADAGLLNGPASPMFHTGASAMARGVPGHAR